MTHKAAFSLGFFAISMAAHLGAQTQPETALKMVQLDGFKVTGTRLPADSIIRLSGIKVGDKVNDLSVNTACHKITATGLVKSIDYFYDVFPDKPGVVLNLVLKDEGDLLTARIQPDSDDAPLWQALLARDPIYTRQLPRTESALRFYSKAIEQILARNGRSDEYAEAIVTNDGNDQAAGIVFKLGKYKDAPTPKSGPMPRAR